MRIVLAMLSLLPLTLSAKVPTLDALTETTPIPAGVSDSDDAAVWKHPTRPERSLILGTSKYDEDGLGGLGVYALDGSELQFFPGSKLNSVDILGNLAVATNRSDNALDLYEIKKGKVSFLKRTPLVDTNGEAFEPYGLCLTEDSDKKLRIYLPTKSGTLYEYALNEQSDAQLKATYDLAALVKADEDALIRSVVTKETIAEGEEDELQENLDERFILEGCVFDSRSQKLYVGMENLGIWRLDAKNPKKPARLVIPIQGSWTDIDQWGKADKPRVTDDIEGMDIVEADGRSYLLFSSQGISEFTLYDLTSLTWKGNFQIRLDAQDTVTQTDGLAVSSGYFSKQYPEGILIVHDDANTDGEGNLLPANYKLVSLESVLDILDEDEDDEDDD